MAKTGTAIGALLAGLLLAHAARAADIGQDLLQAPELSAARTVEVARGWYLRGDVGYDFAGSGDVDSDWSGSAGFGYRFTDLLRSDVTFEYQHGDFDGSGSQALSAYGVMVNGYVDLGTFVGVTPYVGVGAGMIDADWGDYTDTAGTSFAGANDWRFAYQLSAGFSYGLTKALKLDVGYRYLNVAGGDRYIDAGGGHVDDDGFSRNEVRVGLRYALW